MPTDERVLVIPTERFRAAGYFHGFCAADDAYRAAILDPAAFRSARAPRSRRTRRSSNSSRTSC